MKRGANGASHSHKHPLFCKFCSKATLSPLLVRHGSASGANTESCPSPYPEGQKMPNALSVHLAFLLVSVANQKSAPNQCVRDHFSQEIQPCPKHLCAHKQPPCFQTLPGNHSFHLFLLWIQNLLYVLLDKNSKDPSGLLSQRSQITKPDYRQLGETKVKDSNLETT